MHVDVDNNDRLLFPVGLKRVHLNYKLKIYLNCTIPTCHIDVWGPCLLTFCLVIAARTSGENPILTLTI